MSGVPYDRDVVSGARMTWLRKAAGHARREHLVRIVAERTGQPARTAGSRLGRWETKGAVPLRSRVREFAEGCVADDLGDVTEWLMRGGPAPAAVSALARSSAERADLDRLSVASRAPGEPPPSGATPAAANVTDLADERSMRATFALIEKTIAETLAAATGSPEDQLAALRAANHAVLGALRGSKKVLPALIAAFLANYSDALGSLLNPYFLYERAGGTKSVRMWKVVGSRAVHITRAVRRHAMASKARMATR